jgi:hypothetical protein
MLARHGNDNQRLEIEGEEGEEGGTYIAVYCRNPTGRLIALEWCWPPGVGKLEREGCMV